MASTRRTRTICFQRPQMVSNFDKSFAQRKLEISNEKHCFPKVFHCLIKSESLRNKFETAATNSLKKATFGDVKSYPKIHSAELQHATNNAVKNHEEFQNHSISTALLTISDEVTAELKKDANDAGTENSKQSAASTQLQCRITSFDLEQAARQEAAVLKRVNQLRREGLWTASSLPKCAEPPRIKVHSDNMMDELSWMARDFEGERKLKRACCKRISVSVAKAYREREEGERRQNTEAEKHVKRVASLLSKHVREFWNKVDQVGKKA
ncbi:Helicase SRCAP [Trichinella pseudospiralis]